MAEAQELPTTAAPTARRSHLPPLLRACRPKQWLKNVLVFAAPAAAGVLGHRADLVEALIAFVAFCLAASGTYLLNEIGRAHV